MTDPHAAGPASGPADEHRPETQERQPSVIERIVDRIPFLEKELFLLRQLVRPGDVCVDIGAAGGAHLLVMAYRAGAGGVVLGAEPRPGSVRMLRRLVALTRPAAEVRLRQVAVSDEPSVLALRIPVVPTRAHFRGSAGDRDAAAAFAHLPHRTIQVPTITLDGLLADEGLDRLDVVKCDVEGAELLVLAGATRVLTELRPVLLIEADDLHQRRFDATAAEVLATVASYGYHTYRYRRGALEPVTSARDDEDDYVFLPTERDVPVPVRLTP